MKDFSFLNDDAVYLDSACQSLRPDPVINAVEQYFTMHNSCGERVNYPWAKKTDAIVEETRTLILDYLKLKKRHYFTSFTQSTTYGINLLLSQLDFSAFSKLMTSEVEHNSVFLPTITYAKANHLPREVMSRRSDGGIDVSAYDFTRAVVVVNGATNFDQRTLVNLTELTKAVHKAGGIIILDAAQVLAHHPDLLYKSDLDAICASGHKMYAPSVGIMIVKKSLLPLLKTQFIGGGMVDDVTLDDFTLSADHGERLIYTKFEAGLQNYSNICGLNAALKWLMQLSSDDKANLEVQSKRLYDFLQASPRVQLVNTAPGSTLTFYLKDHTLNSHMIGDALADENIMTRTGFFCVHYYLAHKLALPPSIRFSLGYYIRPAHIDKTINTLSKLLGAK